MSWHAVTVGTLEELRDALSNHSVSCITICRDIVLSPENVQAHGTAESGSDAALRLVTDTGRNLTIKGDCGGESKCIIRSSIADQILAKRKHHSCTFDPDSGSHQDGKSVQGFLVSGPWNAAFENIIFEGFCAHGDGGAFDIRNQSEVLFSRCEFTHNYADLSMGGAVFIQDWATVTFSRCRFLDNWAKSSGHALALGQGKGADLNVVDSEFLVETCPKQGAILAVGSGGKSSRVAFRPYLSWHSIDDEWPAYNVTTNTSKGICSYIFAEYLSNQVSAKVARVSLHT